MASAADRRRAQRQLAANLRANRPTLPSSITRGYKSGQKQQSIRYLKSLPANQRPEKGTEDAKVIARAASYMAHDDDYDYDYDDYAWAEDYWYHD